MGPGSKWEDDSASLSATLPVAASPACTAMRRTCRGRDFQDAGERSNAHAKPWRNRAREETSLRSFGNKAARQRWQEKSNPPTAKSHRKSYSSWAFHQTLQREHRLRNEKTTVQRLAHSRRSRPSIIAGLLTWYCNKALAALDGARMFQASRVRAMPWAATLVTRRQLVAGNMGVQDKGVEKGIVDVVVFERLLQVPGTVSR